MHPRSFIAFFALLTLIACIETVRDVEAVTGFELVLGVVIGTTIGLFAAMSCVRRFCTEGLPPPPPLWRRVLIYAVGVPVGLALVETDLLPSVPHLGSSVRTVPWVVFLVLGATASVGVGTWWRFKGRPGTRQ
jgi:hypothetical protein